jgi:tRNA (guanine-N(7)-)-methyltransferase
VTLQEIVRDLPHPGGVEVEIGCGNGHFIAEYAAHRPGTLLVGLEIKEKRCRKAREKVEHRGLGNVVIVHGGAEGFIRDIGAGTVDAFHLYFPDPWPKSRHRKRRFFAMDNLRWLHDGLRPGGRLWFATDWFDYYLQAKVLLLAHGGFLLADLPAPWEAYNSLYSRRFAGSRTRLVAAVRRSADEPGRDQEHQQQVGGDRQADQEGRGDL